VRWQGQETEIALTPVHEGRFEIYVNGEKLYDRPEPGTPDFYPSLKRIREVQQALGEVLAAAGTTA
jgi:predicted Rdx family selenoprotein